MKRTHKSNTVALANILLDNKALVILLVLVAVIGTLTNGLFFSVNNVKNVIRQVCSSITLGCGFTLIMACGGNDLSIGAMVSLISILSAKLSLHQNTPFGVVILISLVIGAAVGCVNGSIINLLDLPAFIVTLGMTSIFNGLACIAANNTSVTGIPAAFRFLGQGYLLGIPFPIYITVVFVVVTWFIINKTRFGRYCLARGGNAAAARACGVNVARTSILAYTWLGFCAGMAALILTGRSNSGQTSAGEGLQMDIIAAVVIGGTSMAGGVAKILGTVFGCLLIGVINNGLNLLRVDSNWQGVAKGIIIIVAIFLDAYGEKFISAIKNREKKAE